MARDRDPHDPDDRVHRERPQRRRKNTRDWCKGKVGRPHEPELRKRAWYGMSCRPANAWVIKRWGRLWWCSHAYVCSVCGKVLVEPLPWRDCPDLPEDLKVQI